MSNTETQLPPPFPVLSLMIFSFRRFSLARALRASAGAALLTLSASCALVQPAPAQAQTASIVFDETPRETGLRLDKTGLRASSVTQNGRTNSTWLSGHKSVAADDWARSFGLTFTDAAFKNGKAPVVEVEIKYWNDANTAVEVMADTTSGSRKVASGWGNKKELQTLKFRIDDAYFGARKHGNDAKTLPSDGYDLRVNSWANDFQLASVRVTAIDKNKVSDWTPFLSFVGSKSEHNWVLEPKGTDKISYEIKNTATQNATGIARWEVVDLGGKILSSKDEKVVLNGEKTTPLNYAFDGKDLLPDEYSIRLSLLINGADGKAGDQPFLARERSLMIAEKDDVFILFDKEPIARGMSFNREGMSATEIEVGGVKRWIWRGDAIFGAEPWWRSAKFDVTDPRFTSGKRPVTDVRFTYRHAPNAPVTITAQSEKGPRVLANEWGNNSNWSTSRTNFDDAKWGARASSSDPKKLMPDGADLRLSVNSGVVEIRSIRVRGYDLDVPNWTRLIRFDGLDAGRERFVFKPGEKADIALKLFNLSNLPFPSNALVKLRNDMGEPLWARRQNATLAPRKLSRVPVAFDTKGLKQSVYLLNLEMGLATKNASGAAPNVTPSATSSTRSAANLVEQEVNLMVSPTTPIARARPGEFLHGMDTGGSWHDDWLLGWSNFIGADILRTSNASLEEMPAALKKLNGLGMTAAHMVVPEYRSDANDRRKRNAELAAYGAKIAAAQPEIKYYELGNEPDLTYFYAGSPAEYVEDYIQIYDAIKKANPRAIVMNGGLCFAGEEGDRRAREIIKLLPLNKIDAWAYHAHGPGAQAERAMLNKIRDEARKWGKDKIPFIQTESGVAAGTLVQQRMQARTVIQKFAYAQSEKIPVFHWFRVFISGGDGGYTNVKNAQEPRPVILSYRTTVQQLRGYRFARKIDLDSPDYEGYLFVQNGPNGQQNQTGKGRVLVAWANARGGARRLLNLENATDISRVDMFGNEEKGETSASVAGVTIDADPLFLRWTSSTRSENVRVLPSLLEVAPTIYLAPQSRDLAQVTIKNSGSTALDTQLLVSAPAKSGVSPVNKAVSVKLASGESKTISVPLQVESAPETLSWPRRWMVFPNVAGDRIKFDTFKTLPGKITSGGKTVVGQSVSSVEGRLDLAPIGGGFGERKEAVLFAEVDSPRAQTVKIGASADWYMQWFVNGKSVKSTIDDGNGGGQSLTAHVFPITLKAGKNLIAVRVQSGSQGWNFLSGGPQELAEAQGNSSGAPASRLTFALQNVGQSEPLALESARIAFAQKVAGVGTNWNASATYKGLKPDAILGDIGVNNPFSIEPDSSRWWQGAADLSGRMWLRSDAQNLYVATAIRDDNHRASSGTPNAKGIFAKGDALQIALSAGNRVLDLALAGDGTLSQKGASGWAKLAPAQGELKVERDNASSTTWYFVRVSRSALPSNARFAFNAVASDDDWGVRKQWAPIADGFGNDLNLSTTGRQTGDWTRFVLSAPTP